MQVKQNKINSELIEYKLENDFNMSVAVLNLGGIITAINVANQQGKIENIVLSYADYKQYLDDPNYLGALIGPVAGRIPHAQFSIDGQTYLLDKNDGEHHLHGGQAGLNHVYWAVEPFQTKNKVGLTLSHNFKQNEVGAYPSPLNVKVTYTLTNENALHIDYEAQGKAPTLVSLTNHTYFNLTGDTKQTVANHTVTMNCEDFIELNEQLIPTGQSLKVDNHKMFDFRMGQKISHGLESQEPQNKVVGGGYDHYFYFNAPKGEIIVAEDKSGRKMTIETSQPGLVMYTSNGMTEGLQLQSGQTIKHQGVCFETQGLPLPFGLANENFPSNLLQADEVYQHRTTFKFQ